MKQEDTKEKIIDKALELFSIKGYEAVSVNEIAKAVGIRASSLYNHYPSKQAIFDAIVESIAKQYEVDTGKIDIHVENVNKDVAIFNKISEEELFKKVYQIFEYSLHNETIARFRHMMSIEQFRSPSLSALYSKRYVDRLVEYHANIFKYLIANKEIINEDPYALSLMYVSPILTLIGVCDREKEKENECIEKLKKHVSLFFKMVHKKMK